MKKLVLVCALSAAAVLLYAVLASAAGAPVSPAPNETVDSPQPTFTWMVPAGDTVDSIVIANNKHTHNGFLSQSLDSGEVKKGQTSYHYTASILTPGVYYWQLGGFDSEGNITPSTIQRFVVPPIIEFSPVKAKWNPHFDNGRPVDYFVDTIRCNLVSRPEISLKVFQGQKLLKTESFSANWCIDMKPYAFADTYQKPETMPKGTRLTAQFFVKYGSFVAKSPIVPFSAH